MEDLPTVETPEYPVDLNTFAIPNDTALRRVHEVYNPSAQTILLLSEHGRSVYPEVFSRLGTLMDLCVSELARSFGPKPNPMVASNPLLLQVHYDALDVDLPLAECYDIKEERFWKRVVLTKHKDKTLAIKSNVNWKNLGISLKYVELVENCSAEYWPEEEMKELALKVKAFVNEMHIQRLMSLKERSFEKYFQSESETSSEESSNEEDSESLESTTTEEETETMEGEEKTPSQIEQEEELAIQKEKRKKERQALREAKEKAREAKRLRREARLAKRANEEQVVKKPRKRIPTNVFAIQVSESEDDEKNIIDKRNKELLLRHIKKYDYPPKDCHHIDLRFVQHFVNLEIFTLEFLGPIQNRHYHKRHMNFSYDDIKHLATGLSQLRKLKIFRLRNSRMSAEKLSILCRVLGALPSLETLDFGYDQLQDDCGIALTDLFYTTESLKNLELESNFLGEEVLKDIGKALSNYNANELLYLGLARNPITDEALHALVSIVIGTNHVQELNIRGVQFLTDEGLRCCIANELLKQHPSLLKLDICALKISPLTANEIMKSLVENKKILQFYCCGCELDEETEIDINVILRRNKFIAENYYLGDLSVTMEEVTKWLNRTRNPILTRVLAEKELQKECMEKRAEDENLSLFDLPAPSSRASIDIKTLMYDRHLSESSSSESEHSTEPPPRFVYPANDFDEEQFLKHVFQPGPQERYYYIQMFKEKYLVQDQIRNKSLI